MLSGFDIMANFKRNSQVFDSHSTSIGQLANRNAGGQRAAKTAQSTY